MALGDIGRKISQAGQNVIRGTKDLADTAKLNVMITEEQKKLGDFYMQIGKRYYELHVNGPEEEFAGLCSSIMASMEKITSLRDEIKKIKGIKKCAKCDSEVPLSSVFCGVCGFNTAREIQSDRCPNCSAMPTAGAAFCTECGQKL